MKKIYRFVLKSFIGPMALTFFIALFILLMQFLWKYVDDMVGKGFEWYVLAELMFYASATFVPMALPLAVLLASLMTFGNLGEHYELVAIKAAGIS
ncbi:MAG TPA: LptF/LptG family permease, partial [Bacteroidales bacterium]|nr:LptF/LptG family permease [Bacteroidales bacterium]